MAEAARDCRGRLRLTRCVRKPSRCDRKSRKSDALPSGQGVQAERIADLVELFGVNTFSSMDQNNVWGSWPADDRPETVTAALNRITGGSRFVLRIHEPMGSSR